jgi:hypothetical protein
MLASTIQFSNTNQKTRPPENTYPHNEGRFEPDRVLQGLIQKQQRVLPQDPTVCRTSKLVFAVLTSLKKVEQTLHNPSETVAVLAGSSNEEHC